MKKALTYIIFVIATLACCWFGLIAFTTPYGERAPYAIGFTLSFLVAIISIGCACEDKEE